MWQAREGGDREVRKRQLRRKRDAREGKLRASWRHERSKRERDIQRGREEQCGLASGKKAQKERDATIDCCDDMFVNIGIQRL
jgi:hypothetical protein